MKLTKNQLRKLIKEELSNILNEKLQAGGGLSNKEMLEKFNQVNAEVQKLGMKDAAMGGPGLNDAEKERLQKLMAVHKLILRKMFQGTTGAES